ncbi:MAG: ABC transporter permease [Gemmatimonadaceae bacterium]|nr:ABC transporter permease [Gemmatimonadaceae bacterium]
MSHFLASVRTGAWVGVDAMRVNPLRTLLSTLGVVIGVGSLVAVLCLGDGMEQAARTQIERVTDVQTVSISARTSERVDGQSFPIRDYPIFTPVDAKAAQTVPLAEAVALQMAGTSTVDLPETGKRRQTQITGTLSRAEDFYHLELEAGRFFTEAEASRGTRVAVVSWLLARDLMAGRAPDQLLGRTVRINGQPTEVIGVLAPYEGERDGSQSAMVPFAAAPAMLPPMANPRPTTLVVRAPRVEQVGALEAEIQGWVAERWGKRSEKVQVSTSKARLQQAMQGILMFKLFLGAITGISLIVGGIGIMNVLLASVSERTREIGIRKAMGARSRDILLQFLAESVAVAGTGSAIGIVIGLIAAFGITAIIRSQSEAGFLQASFSPSTLAVAALAPILVGLIFGTYPARRAARLSPIDAIRHE